MIRVLHYIGGIGLGGSQSLVVELYKKIDRNKVQFDFVVFDDQYDDKGYKSEIESLGGRIYPCPRYSLKNHFVFCRWWDNFFKQHDEYRILHGHVYSCASVYLPIAKRHGLKTVCHAHSTSNGGNLFAEWGKKIYEFPLRYIPDFLFACSADAGKWLYGKKATSKSNYHVLPNCVDIDRFYFSVERRNEIRKKHGIDDSSFVVGHVGSFRDAKNHVFIISAFEKLHTQLPDSVLLLVGIGKNEERIKQLCEEKGLKDCVIFVGNQHEVEKYYSAMDCFFFPSLWEGLPVSVVEAQASGLPCLLSDTITKDVYLTELVDIMSLSDSADKWVEKLISYQAHDRMSISDDDRDKLNGFDSRSVADRLQSFYIQIA